MSVLKKPIHPCKKDCPDRVVGCATSCERWAEYESLRNEYYQMKLKKKDAGVYTRSSLYKLYPND